MWIKTVCLSVTAFAEVKLKNLHHLLLVGSTKGINPSSPLYFRILQEDRWSHFSDHVPLKLFWINIFALGFCMGDLVTPSGLITKLALSSCELLVFLHANVFVNHHLLLPKYYSNSVQSKYEWLSMLRVLVLCTSSNCRKWVLQSTNPQARTREVHEAIEVLLVGLLQKSVSLQP